MKKLLIRDCEYATSTCSGVPLHCDVYVILDDAGFPLWHESIFLCELAITQSINTVRSYASDLLSFCRMANIYGGWRGITKKIMRGYIRGELFQQRNFRPATLSRHIETLKKFYDWLHLKGYINETPDFEWSTKNLFVQEFKNKGAYLRNQHSFHSVYIDKDEFDQLLVVTKSNSKFIERRNEIVMRLGYECGLRAHEVLDLDSDDISKRIFQSCTQNTHLWSTTIAEVKGKGRKLRTIYIPPGLSETIYSYINKYRRKLEIKNGPLICNATGAPLKDSKLASNVFRNACKAAKISRHHHQGYHRLRKSFGTNLVNDCVEEGRDPWVEVPRRLGHTDVQTTKKYIQFDALVHKRSEVLSALAMSENRFIGLKKQGGIEL